MKPSLWYHAEGNKIFAVYFLSRRLFREGYEVWVYYDERQLPITTSMEMFNRYMKPRLRNVGTL